MSWNYDPYTGEPIQEKWAFDPYTGEKLPEGEQVQERTAQLQDQKQDQDPKKGYPVPPVAQGESYPAENSSSNSIGIAATIILGIIAVLLAVVVSIMAAGAVGDLAKGVTSGYKATYKSTPGYSMPVPEDGPQVEIGDGKHIYIVPDSSAGAKGDVVKPSEPSGSKGDAYDPRDYSNIEFR